MSFGCLPNTEHGSAAAIRILDRVDFTAPITSRQATVLYFQVARGVDNRCRPFEYLCSNVSAAAAVEAVCSAAC